MFLMNSNNNEPWFGAETPSQNLGSGLVLNFWGMIAQVGSSLSLKPKNQYHGCCVNIITLLKSWGQ